MDRRILEMEEALENIKSSLLILQMKKRKLRGDILICSRSQNLISSQAETRSQVF